MMGLMKYYTVMIQMMANENMQEYQTSIAIIDETVRVAKDFLITHPEEAKKVGQIKSSSGEPNIGWGLPGNQEPKRNRIPWKSMLVKGYWLR